MKPVLLFEALILCGVAGVGSGLRAQAQSVDEPQQHQHPTAPAGSTPAQQQQAAGAQAWHYMQDAVLFGTLNRQGSARGDTELIAQNWYMGMLMRGVGKGMLTLSGMFSLDPVTVGGPRWKSSDVEPRF